MNTRWNKPALLRAAVLSGAASLTIAAASPAAAAALDRLSIAEVRAGIAPHLPAARACGPLHDATPGEKISVKLRIEGSTGKVMSATATGRHAATAVGACVAGELANATFPSFTKPALGVLYPVRMPPGLYGPYTPTSKRAP